MIGVALTVIAPPNPVKGHKNAYPTISDLDHAVRNSRVYEQKRLDSLDSCTLMLHNAQKMNDDGNSAEMYEVYSRISRIYDRYQTDSAMIYSRKALKTAEILYGNGHSAENRSRVTDARIMLGKQFTTAGMYSEAIDMLDRIDRTTASPEELQNACSFYIFIYESLLTNSIDPESSEIYRHKLEEYKSLKLDITPEDEIALSEKKMELGDYSAALDILRPVFARTPIESAAMGPIALTMSEIYSRMWLKEESKYCLIVSAMSDLLNGKKEYVALRTLGLELYREGDINRAYTYLSKALEDATFCKARIKIDEIMPIRSIVHDAYMEQKKTTQNIILICLVTVCVFAAALVVAIIHERREKKKYEIISKDLNTAKKLQEEATAKVREASNIKDSYVTGLMLECIARIESFEQYRKNLKKEAIAGNMNRIVKELKSNSSTEREWASFYNVFDRNFLSLFPDFINEFNKLLKDSAKVAMPPHGTLTQELRTFALIRLGINSSEKIALLLRYSRSTIYNYRSKMRLNALSPQTFEKDLMKIQSI